MGGGGHDARFPGAQPSWWYFFNTLFPGHQGRELHADDLGAETVLVDAFIYHTYPVPHARSSMKPDSETVIDESVKLDARNRRGGRGRCHIPGRWFSATCSR